MKAIFIVSISFALSWAMPNPLTNEENSCADCVYTIKQIFSTMSSDEYRNKHEELIINEICPYDTDPNECESSVRANWKYIGPQGLFTQESALGYCSESTGSNCTSSNFDSLKK